MGSRKSLAAAIVFGAVVSSLLSGAARKGSESDNTDAARPADLAPTPPMGWNSFDAYCGHVTEREVKANADELAKNLARYGWKYVVVDYYWYFPDPKTDGHEAQLEVAMDEYGRLLPATNRFPSAEGGKGFKPLADYVHSKGLKFGIHIMRGIPRQAVKRNLPILGTTSRAQDVADPGDACSWSTAMDGVDTTKAAGRAYYRSIAKLYADWGVDYIKADDMSRGDVPPARENFHAGEIEALRAAMTETGRPMVLSLSPGPTPVSQAAVVKKYSQLWRISDDVWDDWKIVKKQFEYCRVWAPYIGAANRWPDADMLPLGRIRIRGFEDGERQTRLTPDEQTTLMTLWTVFRSPLMMGGNLPSLDDATRSLLTNEEVLAVDQASSGNHELFERGNDVAWVAGVSSHGDKYVALFNLADGAPAEIAVTWNELGVSGRYAIRDLWARKDVGVFEGKFSPSVKPHGARLYKFSATK